MRGALALLMLSASCGPSGPGEARSMSEEPRRIVVEPGPDGAHVTVRLTGAGGAAEALGPVAERDGRRALRLIARGGRVPLIGRYRRETDALLFVPAVALTPGVTYEATAPNAPPLVYTPPRSGSGAPRVVGTWPLADALPSNALRLHVAFSEPMRGGPALFERVRLVREDGAVVTGAFRRTERWSPDRRELTLVFHPGRIKRNIPFADGLPPILTPGETVTLVIDPLVDVEGETMARPFRRAFRVEAPDDRRPELAAATVDAPSATAPLRVRFEDAVDPVVARGALTVRAGAEEVACAWVAADDRALECARDAPWPTELEVELGCAIEDYAGNTPVAPFDAPAAARTRCAPRRVTVRPG